MFLYTVSPTGRFCSLQLLRKARLSPSSPPVGSQNLRALSTSNGKVPSVCLLVFFFPARLPEERCPLIGRCLTLLCTSSVSWACLSLAWRHPPAQSYSSPGRISSCPPWSRASRRSRAPRRKWRPGRRPVRSWQWWWSGWGPEYLACSLLQWCLYFRDFGSLWCPQLEKRDEQKNIINRPKKKKTLLVGVG